MGLTFFKRRAHSKKTSSSKTPPAHPALLPLHDRSISKPIPIPSRPITAPSSSLPIIPPNQRQPAAADALVARQAHALRRLHSPQARVASPGALMDDLSWVLLPDAAYRGGARAFAPRDMYYSHEGGGAFEVRGGAGGGYTLWCDPETMARLEGEGVPACEGDFEGSVSDYAASEAEVCVVDNVVVIASEGARVVDVPGSRPQTPYRPESAARPCSLVYDPRGFFVRYPCRPSTNIR